MPHIRQPLSKPLRTQLEATVKAARDAAETGATAAIEQLAVAESRAPDYLNDERRSLRRRLRAHGRALGDPKHADDTQAVQHLIWEIAYQHWHRMLFARFLAENGLLLWEPGAPVSLEDCEALAQDPDPDSNLGARTRWELAGILAARMLPQVFQPSSPVFALALAPEHQRQLEKLLAALPAEVFQASDSLGWVYQFWQAKRKDAVNASEVKIGADELPAVTQLFTEPYMVDFLLHNSLGAWWITRHPETPCPIPLPYLRMTDDGTPAAGRFEGWPAHLRDFKLLDPCCGSGHFLVAAFLMLVPMRMAAEGLSALDAVDHVLAENLHGLELDPRCVEIAVFALALEAWRYPDEGGDALGVRQDMPSPQIACCGLEVAATPQDWMALVPDDAPRADYLRQELRLLHASFAQAPLLGSLLDPIRSLKNDLASTSFETLRTLLQDALAIEDDTDNEAGSAQHEAALAAQGLLDAAHLLEQRYDLVVTNVPYLSRGKQSDALKAYCAQHYPDAKNDLANVFLERCLELVHGPQGPAGVVQIVMPQNWLFLTSYKKQREALLKRVEWNLLARLGAKGFQTPMWDFNVQLLTVTRRPAAEGFVLHGLDASAPKVAQEKAALLREDPLVAVEQAGQLGNPDARIAFESVISDKLLRSYADGLVGLQTSDDPMFTSGFWEHPKRDQSIWEFMQGTPAELKPDAGMSWLVRWEQGNGLLLSLPSAYPTKGLKALGKEGVAIHRMHVLFPYHFSGTRFHQNVAVVVPHDPVHLPAIWCFCSSPEYNEAVRRIDQKLNVTNATLVKVPFDLAHWQQVAAERYPNGLPKPYSDDPTQWLFHGHPQPSTDPLQVAVARLLGYTWPAETDPEMALSDEAHAWIGRCAALAEHVDDDGIVCLPSVRGERPAHERLLNLLIAAWETVQPGSWKPAVLDHLLADADCAGKDLEIWLRDKFFEQHAKLFHHRPFIWHVWDGLKDGFSVLVNYHKLDAKNLERLIHTYLGDWIRQQEDGVRSSVDGAPTRLAAAQDLKHRLMAILEGEAPYDIFVRWKPLAEQAIGWNPDLNDGVRLNIRPWMTAEVLRHNKKPKLNITWQKDRGKDVESAPWYPVFKGDRINDYHLSLAEKQAARG
ncbi:Type II restriction enzyme, methylase subunits [Castellaniella defragrans 65Phen]|uniref:site-specific DNA-methyltransferase (adenine-specific) n=2 Tax=Castellaniella defragrans TaxID=75697 RepID=W8WZL2_CASD6|nr:Type II restriction enzyme, methylase subunits [Castellaniella defragrans 65Phen]